MVRSPKKRRPNKSPEKVTKTEKINKESAQNKSDVQKAVQEKENIVVDTTVKPQATTSEKENVETPVVETQVTEVVEKIEEKPPAEVTKEWDGNTSLEVVDIRLNLSPDHSAESGSGKLFCFQ